MARAKEIRGLRYRRVHPVRAAVRPAGNAGKFLDPVFSSGVTIALKSASLAVPLVKAQLAGETVDWKARFADP